MHLILDTGGGVAEDALVEDGEDTAASTLADGGADLGEVVGIGGSLWGDTAVKVGKTEDIGSTALRRAVEAGARNVGLAVLNGSTGSGSGEANKGGKGDDGELHVGG